ncbi:hypothetical protein N7492_009601 [Penicillium capsulatum]|uniref:Acyltransferase 3 domain-containing protein n=1 Tax=Penicillium capsulatum TaxID=69766 RepID=A0A9W9HUA0_9EURO|nr:hypothetical protein N7492_009601 [Penicillium capsulatum]KAJ6106989.1 hypothetical protein N7512_010506 [Penicillium capsulatum]
MQRALWLDGLRGIAAAGVTFVHAWNYDDHSPVFGFLFRSYWSDPPEDNHYFIQLPPFRLLFDGSAMVALFMVISGFAISISILKARNGDLTGSGNFLRRVASASTRRLFRIYFPVMMVAIISHILFFCNAYQSWAPEWHHLWGLKPLTAPWLHIKYLSWYLLHLLDVFNHGIDINTFNHTGKKMVLNNQFWTIPIEYRGSCIVYLLLATTVFWRPQPRRATFVLVAAYWFWVGQWDIFAFVAGLWICEGHVVPEKIESDGEIALPCDSPPPKPQRRISSAWKKAIKWKHLPRVRTAICFLVGMYFLCMPDDEPLGAEYQFLRAYFHSPNWHEKEMERRCWISLGAVLMVYSIRHSRYLQAPLNTRPVQYLGRISFPLYLIHMVIYLILQRPLKHVFWFLVRHEWYPGKVEASKDKLPFAVAWSGSLVVMALIMLPLSDVWERVVDRRCLEAGKKFERWVVG